MTQKFGVPTEEQLAKINKISKVTLSADEVFAFSGKSAGDLMIPGRYMRLSPELLQVMVDDAKGIGVSFMLNHNWSNWGGIQAVPFGKVYDGKLMNSANEGETVELHLDKFVVRDDEVVDGVSINALIKRIETGVMSDTSIGWGTDVMVCSICGMNYYGGKCSHWRGQKYELADGTEKVCTVTAMPPSIIIPYNNNALYEESIVWDGAYPGAVVAQSKHGDIIELPTGKFTVVQDKEELPEGTVFNGFYHNGDIVTMVKKSDHKKVFAVKGDEKVMNEEALKKMLNAFGVKLKEGNNAADDILNQLADKYEAHIQTIKDSVAPLAQSDSTPDLFMTTEQVKEKLGKELTADEVLSLAKEGQDYHNKLADEALAMGVRAMGNDFPKETWEKTFSTMSSKGILDITATWKTQAEAAMPAGRHTDPGAGLKAQMANAPDEAFKVGK